MKYMPQEVFDYGAINLAMIAYLGGDVLEGAKKIASDYERVYLDRGMARQWLQAAQEIQRTLPTLFLQAGMDDAKYVSACRSIAMAMEKYAPTGARKRRFLRGAAVSGAVTPVLDKVRACVANVTLYHIGIINGRIDLKPATREPSGWLRYLGLLAVAIVSYGVVTHTLNPIPRPDVRPGEEYLVYAMVYPAYFLFLYIPFALVSVVLAKIIPTSRSTPISAVLTWVLIPTLIVWGVLTIGGWYGHTRGANQISLTNFLNSPPD